MRTPEDILDIMFPKSMTDEERYYRPVVKSWITRGIKIAQQEAWNEAISLAADKAEIKSYSDGDIIDFSRKVVDKDSILQLKRNKI